MMRPQRPDRQDGYLILKGFLQLFLGYAYAVAPVPRSTRSSLSTVTDTIPLHVFGFLWIAAGCYCIVAGLMSRKVAGFAVGVFMPSIWGLLYVFCWLHGDPGRGWVTAGIFWSIAGAMYLASGLIDPRWILRRRDGRR